MAPFSTSLRRPSRFWAILALAILSVGLFGPLAHLAVVPHVACAVDGELAHGEHAEHSEHADHGDEHAHPHEGARIGQEAPEEKGHGHCQLLLGLPPVPGESSSETTAALPRASRTNLIALHENSGLDAFPRFLLAPKQSPPKRA